MKLKKENIMGLVGFGVGIAWHHFIFTAGIPWWAVTAFLVIFIVIVRDSFKKAIKK